MGCLDVIIGGYGVVNGVKQTKAEVENKLKKEQSFLSSLNPDQRKIYQEFFHPGYGLPPKKGGCFGGKGEEIKEMSVSEYKSMVSSYITSLNIRKKALNKLGIDEDQVTEIAPVEFRGFCYPKNAEYRGGCSNIYEVTWLFFSASQLFVYSITLDTISNTTKERTEEYFYKDVTNFSSSTESVETTEMVRETKKGGCGKPDVTNFTQKKSVLDTARFKIVVPGEAFQCAMEADEEIEKRIQGMKQKLREKKS